MRFGISIYCISRKIVSGEITPVEAYNKLCDYGAEAVELVHFGFNIAENEEQVQKTIKSEIEYAVGLECTLKSVAKPVVTVEGKTVTIKFPDLPNENADAVKEGYATVMEEANVVIANYFTSVPTVGQDGVTFTGTHAESLNYLKQKYPPSRPDIGLGAILFNREITDKLNFYN